MCHVQLRILCISFNAVAAINIKLRKQTTWKREQLYITNKLGRNTWEWSHLVDLIVLGFNNTSTRLGHFVLSPREREKRDSRGDEGEGKGRMRKMNENGETEEIKTSPFYPYLLQGQQAFSNCKPISVGRPNVRYTTPLPNPTTPGT